MFGVCMTIEGRKWKYKKQQQQQQPNGCLWHKVQRKRTRIGKLFANFEFDLGFSWSDLHTTLRQLLCSLHTSWTWIIVSWIPNKFPFRSIPYFACLIFKFHCTHAIAIIVYTVNYFYFDWITDSFIIMDKRRNSSYRSIKNMFSLGVGVVYIRLSIDSISYKRKISPKMLWKLLIVLVWWWTIRYEFSKSI